MKWPKRKIQTVDTEAQDAQERARRAQIEANHALEESKARGNRARRERDVNHFGPLIWKAFGGK